MNKNWIIWLVIAGTVIVGGGYFISKNGAPPSPSNQPEAQQAATASPSPTGSPSTNTSGKFTIDADDSSASQTTINVSKGQKVSITFNVKSGTTYHGGLDFRSDVVSTGTIASGSSKTINFTANKSFTLTPYWPATNIQKPYTISVVVQ